MNPETWQKVSATLDRLLDLTAQQQAEFLCELRARDPLLAQEIESLLEQQTDDLLETPPSELLDAIQTTLPGMKRDSALSSITIQQAGRLTIGDEIARGGMGAIFRANDPHIGRVLAVKVLLPQARNHPHAEERFLQEGQITGRLQHPGIPPIHELGRLADGLPYFAMKLIQGQTLTTLIGAADFKNTDGRWVGVFEQVCRTLAYAHSEGVIHRDLKPSNVMVGAFGEVQVMDWGLAKACQNRAGRREAAPAEDAPMRDDDGAFSRAGDVIGTPAFMAPEQARGETDTLDERCDVFGLGGILCALLTGKPPFVGSASEMVNKAARGDLGEAFAALDACGADPALIEIARQCLAPTREDRFANAREVAEAVTRYREAAQEKLRQAELAREKAHVQVREERRRRRVTLTLAASLLVLLVGIASAGLWYQQYSSQRQARARNLNQLVARSLDDADRERQQLIQLLADPNQVHFLLSNLQPWQERLRAAKSHWRQASKLADSDPQLLDEDLLERLRQQDATLAGDEKDETFARELDGIRLNVFEPTAGKSARTEQAMLAQQYAALFRTKGWDFQKDDFEELLPAMRQSSARYVIAIALEAWAENLIRWGNPADGRIKRLLEMARQLDPDPWRDRFRRGETWSDGKRLQSLVNEMKPEKQPPQVIIVAAELQRYHRQDPTPLMRSALLHYPGNFWLHYQHGHVAYERNEDIAGLAAHGAALALRPRSHHTLNYLGVWMGRKGDFATAGEFFRKALHYNPSYAKAQTNLAKVHFERGQYAAAVPLYRKALESEPNNPIIHNNLGAAVVQLDDATTALKHFDAALKLSPGYDEAHNNRGIALRELGRIDEALKFMKEAHRLKATPNRARLIDDYEKALHLSKKETQGPVELAQLSKGLAGKLSADLPLDIFNATRRSYRASHLVRLQKGRCYQIDLTGDFDTYLRIEDGRFNSILFNDDVRYPDNLHSRLVFVPAKDDLYRLVATTYKPATTGAYQLRVTEVAALKPTVVFRDKLTAKDQTHDKGKFYKWHPVALQAEHPYTITLESPDFNTLVRLCELTTKRAFVQNTVMTPGKSRYSRIDFAPRVSGAYHVLVSSTSPGVTGEYTLTVQGYAIPKAKGK